MPNHRLLAILTGLMLFGSAGLARAAYDLAQHQQIEKLVSSRNLVGLRLFLSANPEVMRGDDELGQELTRVYFCAIGSGLDCFNAPRPTVTPVQAVPAVPATVVAVTKAQITEPTLPPTYDPRAPKPGKGGGTGSPKDNSAHY